MDIDATVLVRAEKLRRQNFPVSYDDCGICLIGSEQIFSFRRLDLRRLMNC